MRTYEVKAARECMRRTESLEHCLLDLILAGLANREEEGEADVDCIEGGSEPFRCEREVQYPRRAIRGISDVQSLKYVGLIYNDACRSE